MEKQANYSQMIAEKDVQIKDLSEQMRILEDKMRDMEYTHCIALLEKDKQIEVVRTELLQTQDEKISKLWKKYEEELEKLREKNEAAQNRIQELIASK